MWNVKLDDDWIKHTMIEVVGINYMQIEGCPRETWWDGVREDWTIRRGCTGLESDS